MISRICWLRYVASKISNDNTFGWAAGFFAVFGLDDFGFDALAAFFGDAFTGVAATTGFGADMLECWRTHELLLFWVHVAWSNWTDYNYSHFTRGNFNRKYRDEHRERGAWICVMVHTGCINLIHGIFLINYTILSVW